MTTIDFIPLQSGELCPFNSNDWETIKNQRNCQDPEFYHCIPDQYNVPGQICVKPNWASKNYCPIFNTAANEIDLIPCDLQYGACPGKDYRSNMVYQYAGCLNKTQIIGRTTTGSADVESSIQLNVIIPAVVAPIVLLFIIIGVVIYYCRSKGAKYDANDIELQPLLHENRVPWSFLKTVNYLDNKVFYSTESYSDAVGKLSTYHHTTLIGPPGSGKTSIAVQLARLQYGRRQKSQIFFCNTLEAITALSELGIGHMYIIMDDWLNHYVYYPSKITEDKKLFDKIFDDFIKNKTADIIFTVQEDIWFACKPYLSKHKLFSSKSCVSISNKSFDKKVVQHMVINHVRFCEANESSASTQKSLEEETLPNGEMDKLTEKVNYALEKDLKSDKTFSLPVMIDLICANTSLVPPKTVFFKDDFSKIVRTFLLDWMNDKSIDEKNSFCILLFAALRGGKVTPADFTSEIHRSVYRNVCGEYGSECLEDTHSIVGLLRKNQRLKGCLYQESDVIVFRHDSLLCFVLQFLIESKNANVNFFIINADMEILLKRCWIKEPILKLFDDSTKGLMPNEPVGAVIIPIDALKYLAKRIHKEMLDGYSIPDWPEHVLSKHKTFSKMWMDVQTESNVTSSGNVKKILPVSDESEMKSDESRCKNEKEESTKNLDKDAVSNAATCTNDLILNGSEKKSKQHKQKEKKSKASTGKDEPNSDKPDSKEGAKQSNGEQSQQVDLSPDLINLNMPENGCNPNVHAENSKQLEKKTKKNGDKISLGKKQTKSKKGASEKTNEETPQKSKISLESTPGDTPV